MLFCVRFDRRWLWCRHLKYPLYKANRPDPPQTLATDVPKLLAIVDAMGIPVLCEAGVEADDVIGSLAVRMAREGFETVIVSPDKVAHVAGCTTVLHGALDVHAANCLYNLTSLHSRQYNHAWMKDACKVGCRFSVILSLCCCCTALLTR